MLGDNPEDFIQGSEHELERESVELANRNNVRQVKAILMQRYDIDESQAYHLIRKVAMHRRKKIADVASHIILTEGNSDIE